MRRKLGLKRLRKEEKEKRKERRKDRLELKKANRRQLQRLLLYRPWF